MSAQPRLFPDKPRRGDICLRRARGNRNSRAAGQRVAVTKANTAERIRIYVAALKFTGATVHEIAHSFGKLPHQISGRLSELKAVDKLFESGRDRAGAAVLVADQRWCNGSAS